MGVRKAVGISFSFCCHTDELWRVLSRKKLSRTRRLATWVPGPTSQSKVLVLGGKGESARSGGCVEREMATSTPRADEPAAGGAEEMEMH